MPSATQSTTKHQRSQGNATKDAELGAVEDKSTDSEVYEDYEVTYEDHKRTQEEDRCCSFSKLAVFILFLGMTFGLVFGLLDLDKINNAINNGGSGNNTNNNGTSTVNDDSINANDDGGNLEQYEFMQCPNSGDCCNGLQSNCDLRPNQLLWATVHNANHDAKLVANNEAPLELALEAGYRGLMLDACLCNDGNGNSVLQFCHTICELGSRNANEVFTNINTFLDDNPTEIIFINFEISSGNPTPQLIWDTLNAVTGLRQKSYIQYGSSTFPTMKTLLLDGKQLILAKHGGLDCTDNTVEGCTQRIFEFHAEAIETNYDFQEVSVIEDSLTSCPGTRGTDGSKRFYAINNFVTSRLFGPSKSSADIINEKSFLEKRMSDCKSVTGYDANLISIDFWQRGDLIRVTQETNIQRGAQQTTSTMRKIFNWFSSN